MFLLMTQCLSLVSTISVLVFFTLSDLQPFLEVGSPFTFSKYSLIVSIGLRQRERELVKVNYNFTQRG